jgi:phenylpropionate dioxygenase-like ring-hydroxylating dioxygenase large terminal subunit
VTDKGLRCAFHAWCWDADGACAAGGGVAERRTIRAYPVREKWGLAWIWAGNGAPEYELPEAEPANERRVLLLPPQRIDCHPHVMLGNGLDVTHVVPVHRFRFEREPAMRVEEGRRLSVDVHARFGATFMRRLLGLAGADARWTFTTIGPSLAWVKVTHPTPFELLWAGTPLPGGGTATQTIFFLPRRRSLVRAVPMMVATTVADRKILTGLDFRPGFVESDRVFERYARLIEEIPEWSA